jgi:cysteine desulfurase
VDAAGLVDPGAVRAAITDRTILVTVMAANNEIGTLAPMAELGAVARERGVLFHTDATQAVGKVPVSVEEWGVGLLSLSAHKLYGPKGAGALYVRSRNPRARLRPQMHGGGHERGLRSGTVNVPGVVGLGRACALAREEMGAEARRLEGLRDRLERGLMERLEGVARNGAQRPRLPGNANLSFAGVEGDALMMGIKEIAVSSGSACTSANPEPSHVLKAIGVPPELSRSSIRFGLGRWTTEEEIDFAIERVATVVTKLRQLSPTARGA